MAGDSGGHFKIQNGGIKLYDPDSYHLSIYGVSRRYDGSRPQSVFVLACVRLWLCRPIRDAQSRPRT